MFLEAKHVVQCSSLLSNVAHIGVIVIHHFYHHLEQDYSQLVGSYRYL